MLCTGFELLIYLFMSSLLIQKQKTKNRKISGLYLSVAEMLLIYVTADCLMFFVIFTRYFFDVGYNQ